MKFGGMGKQFGHMGSENPKKAAPAAAGGPPPAGSPIGLLLVITHAS